MLTKAEFYVVSKVIQASCTLQSLPFDWDSVNSELIITKSKSKRVIFKVFAWWRLFLTIGIILRLNPGTTWSPCDRNIVKQVFHGIILICYAGVCSESWTVHLHGNEMCLLFNWLIRFNRAHGKRYNTDKLGKYRFRILSEYFIKFY